MISRPNTSCCNWLEDLDGVRRPLRDGSDDEAQRLGHQGHEDRAEDGADQAAQPADDDHRQVEDRQLQAEVLGRHGAVEITQQRTGHPGVERADRERGQLVVQQVDAQHLGGDVLVADRDEGPADPGAEQVARRHQQQRRHRHDQVVHARVVQQLEAEQAGIGHVDAAHAAGDRVPLAEDELQQELHGQGGHGQVQALDAQAGQAGDDAQQRRHGAGRRQRQEERHAALRQPGGGVAAHAHERGVAQRDQAGVAGHQVQSGSGDQVDAQDARQAHHVAVGQQRAAPAARAPAPTASDAAPSWSRSPRRARSSAGSRRCACHSLSIWRVPNRP